MPQFEVFTKRLVPLTKAPYVTIQTRGTMSFSKSAYAALDSPEAVELLYDPTERIIGIRAVDPTAEHAYSIRPTNNGGSFVVSGTAFVKYYQIDTDASRRYVATMQDDVLCIDLKTEGTVVTQRRGQAATSDTITDAMSDAFELGATEATENGYGRELNAIFKGEEVS